MSDEITLWIRELTLGHPGPGVAEEDVVVLKCTLTDRQTGKTLEDIAKPFPASHITTALPDSLTHNSVRELLSTIITAPCTLKVSLWNLDKPSELDQAVVKAFGFLFDRAMSVATAGLSNVLIRNGVTLLNQQVTFEAAEFSQCIGQSEIDILPTDLQDQAVTLDLFTPDADVVETRNEGGTFLDGNGFPTVLIPANTRNGQLKLVLSRD